MMPALRVNPSVVVSLSQDAALAYHVELNQLHRLNPTAALLMELCDSGRTRDAILGTLKPLMDEAGLAGCVAWLDQAIAQGLIVVGDVADRPALSAAELSGLARDLRYKDQVLAAFICQQRATELAEEDPQQWYALGELAHIIGRRDEAREAYERYHRAHPEDIEIGHLLTALRDEPPPARASNTYIEQLYAHFAPFYEENVCGDLDYRAPQLLHEAIAAATRRSCGAGFQPASSEQAGSLHHNHVLDLGCGTGLFGQIIRPSARALSGIDLSGDMVARAKDRGIYDALETAEITEWLGRARAERYDLISICDTLIYFGDLRQVVPPASRLLSAGGILAFTVEQGERYPYRLTDSGRFAHHEDHLKDVAREANLRVVSLTGQTLRYEYGQAVVGWVAVLAQAK